MIRNEGTIMTPHSQAVIEQASQLKALELTDIDSPPGWHGEALQDAELKYSTGHASFVDWETAKKYLRDRQIDFL